MVKCDINGETKFKTKNKLVREWLIKFMINEYLNLNG
jgi:hypothetical protein